MIDFVANPTMLAIWNTIKANQILLILIFIVFLVISKKLFNILLSSISIAIISALFPFVLNKIGLPIETNLNTVLYFMILGVSLYILYHILRGIAKLGKIFS